MEPHYEQHIAPILLRAARLSALPLAVQIGILDAIAFCLTLHEPLIGDQAAVLALVDAAGETAKHVEDSSPPTRFNEPDRIEMYTMLRVACVRLLSAALACDAKIVDKALEQRIATVFFASLTARAPPLICAARDGLHLLAKPDGIPKELLQASVRSILQNATDPQRVTLPLLRGLRRILECVKSAFNVSLGEHMLNKLKSSSSLVAANSAAALTAATSDDKTKKPDDKTAATTNAAAAPNTSPSDVARRLLATADEAACAAAIVDIFSLLPPAPDKFLEPLLQQCMRRESERASYGAASLRASLLRYVNKFAVDTCKFCLNNAHRVDIAAFFVELCADQHAEPLRAALSSMALLLNAKTFGSAEADEADRTAARHTGIQLCHVLAKHNPAFLVDNASVLACLREIWNDNSWRDSFQRDTGSFFNFFAFFFSKNFYFYFLSFLK